MEIITILVTCKNKDCTHTFRVPEFKYNSTIKNNPDKQECRICINVKVLAKSTLYDKRGVSKSNIKKPVSNRATKPKSGKKRAKRTSWKNKNLNAMIQHVQYLICNPYIRARDRELYGRCISCNSKLTQAGHRYAVGDYSGMRFLVNNIHGQEISCNHFKSGNIDSYDRGLILRHGEDFVNELKQDSLRYLRKGHKFHRFDVIEIGETYKYLHKKKIWIFTQKEFNHFRDKAK